MTKEEFNYLVECLSEDFRDDIAMFCAKM